MACTLFQGKDQVNDMTKYPVPQAEVNVLTRFSPAAAIVIADQYLAYPLWADLLAGQGFRRHGAHKGAPFGSRKSRSSSRACRADETTT
jgi:hypothetical protein